MVQRFGMHTIKSNKTALSLKDSSCMNLKDWLTREVGKKDNPEPVTG